MKIINGVRLLGLKPETLAGLMVTESVYNNFGLTMTVVSVSDGEHDGGEFATSSHYAGMGFDVKNPEWQPESFPTPEAVSQADTSFLSELETSLGEEFHVIAHKGIPVIHVAWIPKRP